MTKSKPVEQFINQESAKEYQCPICLEIVHPDDFVETNCGHIYCNEHKPKINEQCSLDRIQIIYYNQSKKIQRFIKSLQICCDHEDCSWKGEWSDLSQHLEKCLEAPIQCKWNSCKVIEKRKNILQHENTCEWRIVNCQYCHLSIPYKHLSVSNGISI